MSLSGLLRLLLAGVLMAATVGVSEAPAAGRCTMKGPSWDLYGIHDGSHRSGSRYIVTHNHISCDKARRHVRRIFRHLGPHPTGPIKGPAGFRCRGSANGDSRNRMFSGACMGNGPNPLQPWVDAPQFEWGPVFKTS